MSTEINDFSARWLAANHPTIAKRLAKDLLEEAERLRLKRNRAWLGYVGLARLLRDGLAR